MAEVASLLTDQPLATPKDAIAWWQEPTTALSIPGLASYRLNQEEIAVRDRPESEQQNPIELSDEEVGEIVTRSL